MPGYLGLAELFLEEDSSAVESAALDELVSVGITAKDSFSAPAHPKDRQAAGGNYDCSRTKDWLAMILLRAVYLRPKALTYSAAETGLP